MAPSDMMSSGIVLLAVIGVAYGGTFLLRISTGRVPANGLQKTYFRAGHAHAAVLIVLGLVIRLLLADPAVPGWSRSLGDGVLYAAVLMPAGFFLSAAGRDPQQPNGLRALIWIGAAVLTLGVIGAGVGLIAGSRAA